MCSVYRPTICGVFQRPACMIAAKSILRFNELARDASDRRASEYVIIGTLASFAWAIATAWATAAALRALAP